MTHSDAVFGPSMVLLLLQMSEPWWESTVRVGMGLRVVRVRFRMDMSPFLSPKWAARGRALGLVPDRSSPWRTA